MIHQALTYALLGLALLGIAAGRLPFLRMNRASMALAFASLLVAAGSIGLKDALSAIDLGTIVLLLAMMLLVANLRIAGFFTWAGARILGVARSPRSLLCLVILASGILSALFLNDTICLMLTPLVAELAIRSRRNALPYLIALAVAANVGSCATIIGNPQNMLIGASSGIGFGAFFLRLAPPSILGLGATYLAVVLAFPKEFARGEALEIAPASGGQVDLRLAAKSLAAAALMIVLLLSGVPAPLAASIAAALLLFTRRIAPERVFAEVDFSLLIFFSGLFVITAAIGKTGAFSALLAYLGPHLAGGGGASYASLAGATVLLSNLVSNVPTVMLLSPVIPAFADGQKAWLFLALASTYAGNLSLLGSVANLIVAEGARPRGIRINFLSYLKVGLPVTLFTVVAGSLWLLAI